MLARRVPAVSIFARARPMSKNTTTPCLQSQPTLSPFLLFSWLYQMQHPQRRWCDDRLASSSEPPLFAGGRDFEGRPQACLYNRSRRSLVPVKGATARLKKGAAGG